MPLPSTPPDYRDASGSTSFRAMMAPIRRGNVGWRPWCVQMVLALESDLKARLLAAGGIHGTFGKTTEACAREWQARHNLVSDGIIGPLTQQEMLRRTEDVIHDELAELPVGILRGFSIAEGGGILAATNWYTPPGGKSGVDCGCVQWRVYGPPFEMEDLQSAFNPLTAYRYAGTLLLQRITDFRRRRPSLSFDMALRLAILAHNAPFLSDQYVRNGKLTTPKADAGWTKNPETGLPYTHVEWMQEYPDRILAYVR